MSGLMIGRSKCLTRSQDAKHARRRNPLIDARRRTGDRARGGYCSGAYRGGGHRAPERPARRQHADRAAPALAPVLGIRRQHWRSRRSTPCAARAKPIEVSEWYRRRLTIHRYVAYATIPVFAAQWAAGEQLYDKSRAAPTWAKTTHRVGATALAGMFTVNTVTGAWNWWDSRSAAQGRVAPHHSCAHAARRRRRVHLRRRQALRRGREQRVESGASIGRSRCPRWA